MPYNQDLKDLLLNKEELLPLDTAGYKKFIKAHNKKEKTCFKTDKKTKNKKLTQRKFLKKANKYFFKQSQLHQDEALFIIKVSYKNGKIDAYGAYYGVDNSSFTFVVENDEVGCEVYLAEATSKEAMMNFLAASKLHESIYVLKASLKDFQLHTMESIYRNQNNLDLLMFHYTEEGEEYGDVLNVMA